MYYLKDNIDMLLSAVVERACEDYRLALVHRKKSEIELLEKFFLSDDIKGFTKIDGEWLMNEIKKEAKEYNYDLKAIKKSQHPNSDYNKKKRKEREYETIY